MQSKQLQLFRIFTFLLLTIFFADTVYANGMMVADQLCSNHKVSTIQNHDDHEIVIHNHHHEAGQKKSSNDHCSKCGHCMACFTILPPSQLNTIVTHMPAIEISLFEPKYLSYITAHPQRPPIS